MLFFVAAGPRFSGALPACCVLFLGLEHPAGFQPLQKPHRGACRVLPRGARPHRCSQARRLGFLLSHASRAMRIADISSPAAKSLCAQARCPPQSPLRAELGRGSHDERFLFISIPTIKYVWMHLRSNLFLLCCKFLFLDGFFELLIIKTFRLISAWLESSPTIVISDPVQAHPVPSPSQPQDFSLLIPVMI